MIKTKMWLWLYFKILTNETNHICNSTVGIGYATSHVTPFGATSGLQTNILFKLAYSCCSFLYAAAPFSYHFTVIKPPKHFIWEMTNFYSSGKEKMLMNKSAKNKDYL